MDSQDSSLNNNSMDDESFQGQFRPTEMMPYLQIGKELQELRHTVYSMHLSEIANESSSDESCYSDDETVPGDSIGKAAGRSAGSSFITPSYNSINGHPGLGGSEVRGTTLRMVENEVPDSASTDVTALRSLSEFKPPVAKSVSFEQGVDARDSSELQKIRDLSKYLNELISQYSARVLLSNGGGSGSVTSAPGYSPLQNKDTFQTPDLTTQKGRNKKEENSELEKGLAPLSIQAQQQALAVNVGPGHESALQHIQLPGGKVGPVRGAGAGCVLSTPMKSGSEIECPSTDPYDEAVSLEGLQRENQRLRGLVGSFQDSIEDNLAALEEIQAASRAAVEAGRHEHEEERLRWAGQAEEQSRRWEEAAADLDRQAESSRADLQTAYLALSDKHDAHLETQRAFSALQQRLGELVSAHPGGQRQRQGGRGRSTGGSGAESHPGDRC